MPVTNYIYDPVTEALLMETDGDGNMTAWYTQEPVKYGDVIAQHRIDPATGVGKSYYYHPDALGSTRELTDENGDVVATYNYDAFGNTIASTGTVENPFRFTGNVGYYWDEELQAYHIRARNYQPTTGRWTSQDPIGFAGGINLYGAYFIPNATDPSGMLLGYGYGNFCGFSRRASCPPGTSVKKPIDAVDAACERHDCCLERWYHCWKLTSCDAKLCSEVFDAYDFGCAQSYPGDKKKQDACKDAASKIGAVFCWFVAPGVHLYPDGNPSPMM